MRRCEESGCALRCAPTHHNTNSSHAMRCTAPKHSRHTHTLLRSPSQKKLFLNSGFLTSIRERKKSDRHYPLRYAETLCWILHNMLHTLLLSGLETGTVVASFDGGSISCCLPADPRWLAAGRSQGFYFFWFFLVFVWFFHFFLAYKGRVAFRRIHVQEAGHHQRCALH